MCIKHRVRHVGNYTGKRAIKRAVKCRLQDLLHYQLAAGVRSSSRLGAAGDEEKVVECAGERSGERAFKRAFKRCSKALQLRVQSHSTYMRSSDRTSANQVASAS